MSDQPLQVRARKIFPNLNRPFDEAFGLDEQPSKAYSTPDPAPPPWQPPKVEMKSVPLAMILAALVPGLGHMYVRRFAQGLAIFIIVVSMIALYFLIFTIIGAGLVWAWQFYDAYRNAKEFNRRVAETGARPW